MNDKGCENVVETLNETKTNKKRRVFLRISILVLVIILGIVVGTAMSLGILHNPFNKKSVSIFTPRIYQNIDNHVFYTNELLDDKARDRDQMVKLYQIINDELNLSQDVDFCISNLNYDDLSNEVYINGYLMVDGISIERPLFTIIFKNEQMNPIELSEVNSFNPGKVTGRKILTIDKILPIAEEITLKNTKKMFPSSGDQRAIEGEYYMIYDNDLDKILYYFTMNHGCFVKIDAETGTIEDSFFFDGKIY